MGRSVMIAVAAVSLTMATGASYATSYCSEPSPPSCLSYLAIGEPDEFTFSMCRSSMVSYQRDVSEFQRCVKSEADDARRHADDVVEEYNRTVKKFNCVARREVIC